jgi:hypothetical protein
MYIYIIGLILMFPKSWWKISINRYKNIDGMCDISISYTTNGTPNKCSDKFADREMNRVVEQAFLRLYSGNSFHGNLK